jgi:hypothetical protein
MRAARDGVTRSLVNLFTRSLILGAISRAMMSIVLPAPYMTMMRTGFTG